MNIMGNNVGVESIVLPIGFALVFGLPAALIIFALDVFNPDMFDSFVITAFIAAFIPSAMEMLGMIKKYGEYL